MTQVRRCIGTLRAHRWEFASFVALNAIFLLPAVKLSVIPFSPSYRESADLAERLQRIILVAFFAFSAFSFSWIRASRSAKQFVVRYAATVEGFAVFTAAAIVYYSRANADFTSTCMTFDPPCVLPLSIAAIFLLSAVYALPAAAVGALLNWMLLRVAWRRREVSHLH